LDSIILKTHNSVTARGVRNVVKCRPGTRIDFERVPGYPFKR